MTDDDRVFKALADPTRRFLLDLLFRRDGRTLTELENEVEMTRFGVAKHLKVLADAGLVQAEKVGRTRIYQVQPSGLQRLQDEQPPALVRDLPSSIPLNSRPCR